MVVWCVLVAQLTGSNVTAWPHRDALDPEKKLNALFQVTLHPQLTDCPLFCLDHSVLCSPSDPHLSYQGVLEKQLAFSHSGHLWR